MKMGFLTLIHDFEYEEENTTEEHPKYGTVYKTTHPAYLGQKDDDLYNEISHYKSLFEEFPGGPYRQSEHIVHTTPVTAKLVYVYRNGHEEGREGNEDPHNY